MTEIQHELIMPNKDLPFKMFLFEGRDGNYIRERTHIEKREDHAEFTEDDGATWASLPFDTLVSMNFFGFQPMIMDELEKGFPAFLDQAIKENPLKGEYFIPSVASDLLHDGKASLEVLVSKDQWYGVTYPEDKQSVIDALAALREAFPSCNRSLATLGIKYSPFNGFSLIA